MKILLLTSNLGTVGGIQRYNKNLLRAFTYLNIPTVTVERRNQPFGKPIFVIRSLITALLKKPDFIFCGHINFSPLCRYFKRIFGLEYIVFTHGVDVWNLKRKSKIQGLKEAKTVVTVSNYTKSKLLKQIPELEKKIYILPNTVDGEKFYPKDKPKELLDKYNIYNKKVIFTLARLAETEKYKGYDKVIQALPKVLNEIPEVVYILGGKGEDIHRIKKMIANLNLEDKVVVPGFISDKKLVDYYNLCDVFVMPSKCEGCGIVFLEALACGKPVIAGNQDGSVDPLQNGKVGTLINPDNINEIANSLVAVLKGNIDNKLLNGKYLRGETLEKYGFDKFEGRVKNLVGEL